MTQQINQHTGEQRRPYGAQWRVQRPQTRQRVPIARQLHGKGSGLQCRDHRPQQRREGNLNWADRQHHEGQNRQTWAMFGIETRGAPGSRRRCGSWSTRAPPTLSPGRSLPGRAASTQPVPTLFEGEVFDHVCTCNGLPQHEVRDLQRLQTQGKQAAEESLRRC